MSSIIVDLAAFSKPLLVQWNAGGWLIQPLAIMAAGTETYAGIFDAIP